MIVTNSGGQRGIMDSATGANVGIVVTTYTATAADAIAGTFTVAAPAGITGYFCSWKASGSGEIFPVPAGGTPGVRTSAAPEYVIENGGFSEFDIFTFFGVVP